MLNILKNKLLKNFSNIPGWSSKRKIIVFLVDDWGAVRTRDKNAYNELSKLGLDLDSNRFNKYDTLAGLDDLSSLFDVLTSVKDLYHNSAVFTALSVVANPDFNKIRESNFSTYYYEPLVETLKRYYSTSSVFELWKQGIGEGIFLPQFHGREHLNVSFWMESLQNGDYNTLKSFDYESIGVNTVIKSKYIDGYMAAYNFKEVDDLKELDNVNIDGIELFKKLFDYQPTFFTSSSLIHNHKIEKKLHDCGIEFIDRPKFGAEPKGGEKYKSKLTILGDRNTYGQYYITRNCVFEPNYKRDSVNSTILDIETAFRWGKPALISSHRVNFVGGIDQSNRKNGLKALKSLLKTITNKWPDAEFMSIEQLGRLIKTTYYNKH